MTDCSKQERRKGGRAGWKEKRKRLRKEGAGGLHNDFNEGAEFPLDNLDVTTGN